MTSRHSILLLAAVCLACNGFNPAEELTNAIGGALGETFEDYQSFSYPTDNFGLATIYRSTDDEVTPDEFDCDMWNCIGVADADIPVDRAANLSMNGFAAVGTGGEITIEKQAEERLAFGVVLPAVARVAGISGGLERERVPEVSLQLGQAHSRLLRRDSVLTALRGLPPTHDRRLAFNQGALALVVADVVIDGFTATIDVKQETGQELDAKLSGTASTVIGSDAELNFEIRKVVDGRYTINVTRPVIIFRWIKVQTAGGTLSNREGTCEGIADLETCWTGWRSAQTSQNLTLDAVSN